MLRIATLYSPISFIDRKNLAKNTLLVLMVEIIGRTAQPGRDFSRWPTDACADLSGRHQNTVAENGYCWKLKDLRMCYCILVLARGLRMRQSAILKSPFLVEHVAANGAEKIRENLNSRADRKYLNIKRKRSPAKLQTLFHRSRL